MSVMMRGSIVGVGKLRPAGLMRLAVSFCAARGVILCGSHTSLHGDV